MQMTLDFNRKMRDQGAGMALENAGENWNQKAASIALRFLKATGSDGALFEEVREYATLVGLPDPPSPNAWGAVALTLSKQGAIEKTGVYRASKSDRSHARSQPVWRAK